MARMKKHRLMSEINVVPYIDVMLVLLIIFMNIGDKPEAPVEDSVVLERVSAVLRRNPETPVLVKGDQNVPYGRVVVGASLLQQAGAPKVGFLTDPKGLEDNDKGRRPRR